MSQMHEEAKGEGENFKLWAKVQAFYYFQVNNPEI